MNQELNLTTIASTYSFYRNERVLKDHKYKTELCSNFISNGICGYGIRCKFAHGFNDIIKRDIKTKSHAECTSLSLISFCPYGNVCDLTHSKPTTEKTYSNDEKDSLINEINISKIISNTYKYIKQTKRLKVFDSLVSENDKRFTDCSSSECSNEDL